MLVFYLLTAIVIWLGIISLRGGIRFAEYARLETAQSLPNFTPFVSVIAPTRGVDQGLRENLTAIFQQEYPAYEIIFVTDSSGDSSLPVIDEVKRSAGIRSRLSNESGITTRLVVAGAATDSGQKVHNLRAAVGELDSRSQVLVFVDTDVRPQAQWLRSLVAPLQDQRIGAATGYRWFIPLRGGLASHLRSVWNASIASALGANIDQNFCWGGSTAIRRETFEDLNVRERWRGTVSDDFALTKMLKEANLMIHFVPACLIVSLDDCNLRELFEFTTRQLKITRVYSSHLWRAAFLGSLLFSLVFFGGILLVGIRVALGGQYLVPLMLLCTIFALGVLKAYIRLRAVAGLLTNYSSHLRQGLLAHLFLWPIASALFLYNAVAAVTSRRINWRGITYELKSPTEAVIIRGSE